MSTAKEAELDAKVREYKSLTDQANVLHKKADTIWDELRNEISHEEVLNRLRALVAAARLH